MSSNSDSLLTIDVKDLITKVWVFSALVCRYFFKQHGKPKCLPDYSSKLVIFTLTVTIYVFCEILRVLVQKTKESRAKFYHTHTYASPV